MGSCQKLCGVLKQDSYDLTMKNVNLTNYQKEVHYLEVRLFGNLLSPVARFDYDIKPFKH